MSMRIKYIIPEDGDEIDHPNVFNLQPSSNNHPTLGDMKKSFPPSGAYFFRFLKQLSPENKVWLDLSNDSDSLPTLNGSIFAKVSRITTSNNHNNVNTTKSVSSANSGLHSSVLAVAGGASSSGNNNKGGVFNNKEVNLLGDDDRDDFHPFNSTNTTNGSKSSSTAPAASGGSNNSAKPSQPSGASVGGNRVAASSSGKPTPTPVNLFDTTEFEAAGDLLDMTSSDHNPSNYGNGNRNNSMNQQASLDVFDTVNFKSVHTLSPTAIPTMGGGINNNNNNPNSSSSSSSSHNGLKNSVSVDRGIDSIINSSSSSISSSSQQNQQQQSLMRSVQQQQQQSSQQKQAQQTPQQQQLLRGQNPTRDVFSGLGDLK